MRKQKLPLKIKLDLFSSSQNYARVQGGELMEYFKCESGVLNQGDVLQELKKLDDKSVNCVITSPPYWQLRDYGFPEQWGLEPTFEEYLEHLWSMMDEIWRVLRDDGTVWVNLGDSYRGHSWANKDKFDKKKYSNGKWCGRGGSFEAPNKCLLLIPHRFAIGCIDRGWIMRNDIIWAKRNGMPESVTDRFSKKHEYVFFMTKSQKYYFDLDGVRGKLNIDSVKRELRGNREDTKYGSENGRPNGVHANTMSKSRIYKGYSELDAVMLSKKGKNPGSVSDFWDINTKPSKKKHYAMFNTQLIDKPIIAGCPEGGIILDPFNGTGTTTRRAEQLGRKWIGIDGSEESCEIAKQEIENERSQLRIDF